MSICHDIEAQLTDYCVGELAPDQVDVIQHHLDQCASCQAAYEEVKAALAYAKTTCDEMAAPSALSVDRRQSILDLAAELDAAAPLPVTITDNVIPEAESETSAPATSDEEDAGPQPLVMEPTARRRRLFSIAAQLVVGLGFVAAIWHWGPGREPYELPRGSGAPASQQIVKLKKSAGAADEVRAENEPIPPQIAVPMSSDLSVTASLDDDEAAGMDAIDVKTNAGDLNFSDAVDVPLVTEVEVVMEEMVVEEEMEEEEQDVVTAPQEISARWVGGDRDGRIAQRPAEETVAFAQRRRANAAKKADEIVADRSNMAFDADRVISLKVAKETDAPVPGENRQALHDAGKAVQEANTDRHITLSAGTAVQGDLSILSSDSARPEGIDKGMAFGLGTTGGTTFGSSKDTTQTARNDGLLQDQVTLSQEKNVSKLAKQALPAQASDEKALKWGDVTGHTDVNSPVDTNVAGAVISGSSNLTISDINVNGVEFSDTVNVTGDLTVNAGNTMFSNAVATDTGNISVAGNRDVLITSTAGAVTLREPTAPKPVPPAMVARNAAAAVAGSADITLGDDLDVAQQDRNAALAEVQDTAQKASIDAEQGRKRLELADARLRKAQNAEKLEQAGNKRGRQSLPAVDGQPFVGRLFQRAEPKTEIEPEKDAQGLVAKRADDTDNRALIAVASGISEGKDIEFVQTGGGAVTVDSEMLDSAALTFDESVAISAVAPAGESISVTLDSLNGQSLNGTLETNDGPVVVRSVGGTISSAVTATELAEADGKKEQAAGEFWKRSKAPRRQAVQAQKKTKAKPAKLAGMKYESEKATTKALEGDITVTAGGTVTVVGSHELRVSGEDVNDTRGALRIAANTPGNIDENIAPAVVLGKETKEEAKPSQAKQVAQLAASRLAKPKSKAAEESKKRETPLRAEARERVSRALPVPPITPAPAAKAKNELALGPVAGKSERKLPAQDPHVVIPRGPTPRLPAMKRATQEPVSTFSIDVDTASYTAARNEILNGGMPAPAAVRPEEFINYFDYKYETPKFGTFAIHTEMATSPFVRGRELLRVAIQSKRPGADTRRPSAFTFLVDISGSMAEPNRLPLIKRTLPKLLKQLRPDDRVTLMACSMRTRLILDRVSAREEERIVAALEQLQSHGATNLEAGLVAAYGQALQNYVGGAYNRVILISDGVANLGNVEASGILNAVANARQQGVTLTVLGFGRGQYNDRFLETLANKGDGNYLFVDSDDEAERTFVDQFAAHFQEIARDVKIQVEFDPAQVSEYRLIGYANRRLRKQDFRNDKVDAGEVGAGQSVTALYELVVNRQATVKKPLAEVRVRYKKADRSKVVEIAQEVQRGELMAFVNASPGFRLATVVAEYAQWLRYGPQGRGVNLDTIRQQFRPVAADLAQDPTIREFQHVLQQTTK